MKARVTGRTVVVGIGAVVLYFFANQTQVGWLYVMAALIMGLLPAAWWLGRRGVRGVTASRRVGDGLTGELYENDEIAITLSLRGGQGGGAQIRLVEACPLAAPDAPERAARLYVPSLPARSAVHFTYAIEVYKRGVYQFPPLTLETRAPFGFFARTHVIDEPSPTLVYPEVKRLARFDFLDRRHAPQVTRPSVGVGYEVMGLRGYRTGDSPRQIHWRSVARTGQLISKEFADETQPGALLALDLFAHPYAQAETKHTPFEWAVKAAASIGDYALRIGCPLTFTSNDDNLPAPPGMIGFDALLQILARVQPVGDVPLIDRLRVNGQGYVVVVLPYPDSSVTEMLIGLTRAASVLAVIGDPHSFPDAPPDDTPRADDLATSLQAGGVQVRVIRFGDDLTAQLAEVQHVYA